MTTAMLPSLANAEWLGRPQTQAVFAALAAAGFEARAVGGCVRNALMGLPVTDIDIATTAPPADIVAAVTAAGMAAIPTGIDHGTVTVVVEHHPFEVTTLRRDVATDGRRAVVAFTRDWAEDARRRDFTMNALYCDADGQVFDPLGGYADLRAARVRFIGDPEARIREDYLRILRFFRFHAMYGGGGPPDAEGARACVRLHAGMRQLSAERVGGEVMKLLGAQRALETVEAMFGLGLLVDVLASAPRLATFARLARIEGEARLPPDPGLRLAALAVHVAEDAGRLAERLRLSGEQRAVLAVSAPALSPARPLNDNRTALYRLGPADFRRCVLLNWASTPFASVDDQDWRALLELPDTAAVPPFPLAGRDLLALGLPPGPGIGELLRRLELKWMDSGFTLTAEQLLAGVRVEPGPGPDRP